MSEATTERSLQYRAEALKRGIESLRDLCGDDEELLADMIEGQIDLDRFADKCLEMEAEDAMRAEALKSHIERLEVRRKRFVDRAARVRSTLAHVMSHAETRKLERPGGTISLRNLPPDIIIASEEDIPASYWKRPDPKLDRATLRKDAQTRDKALREARQIEDETERAAELERIEREHPAIPGIDMDNGDISIAIRRV